LAPERRAWTEFDASANGVQNFEDYQQSRDPSRTPKFLRATEHSVRAIIYRSN
jgi:hypothetical protein